MTEQVLQALRRRSNHHGLVIVREGVLLDELRLSPVDLRAALKELEERRLIEVLSPLPFLVLKWSGKRSSGRENDPKIGPAGESRYSSYSFNNKSIDKNIAIKAIGVPGKADADALLQEILVTLGKSDPTTFRGVLQHYSIKHIRTVLDRVRATPPEKFRKSKTALFRYLLARTKKSPVEP
jgi:hypothetical protein